MKRIGNLYDKIISLDNLRIADDKARKGKKKPTRKEYKQSIASWWGWCKYCDSINLVRTLKEKMPYEVRFTRT